MKPEQYLEEAARIAALLVKRYCNEEGLLAEKVDCLTGSIVSGTPLVSEFGDYVQYVTFLGMLIEDQQLINWGRYQVLTGANLYRGNTGLIHPPTLLSHGKNPQPRYCSLWHACDTIWGMVEVFRLIRDSIIKEYIDSFYEAIIRYGMRKGFIVYGCAPLFWGKSLTIPLSHPMIAGYFGESLLNLYEITADSNYLHRARLLLEPWLEIDQFKNYRLFSRVLLMKGMAARLVDFQFKLRGTPPLSTTTLVKGDAYLIFALLALYRHTHKESLRTAIYQWGDRLGSIFTTDLGLFYNRWDSKSKRRWDITLGTNHSIIEVLLDIYHDLGDATAIQLAQQCATGWLRFQNRRGLICNTTESSVARLDPQVDFAINLLKLWEITGDDRFKDCAERGIQALLKFHRLPYGFAESLDCATGKPIDNIVETKYLGLLIKGLLVFYFKSLGKSLFSNNQLRALASDR